MKRIFICIFLIFFSLIVRAEFVNTYTDANEKNWVDTTSIEGTGNLRRIYEIRNFRTIQSPKPGFEHLSKMHVYEFNCKDKTFKVLMTIAFEKHQGAGRPIFKDDIPTPNYMPVRSGGSVSEAMRITCK